jgi:hypothetical protein
VTWNGGMVGSGDPGYRPPRTPVGNHLWAAAGTGIVCGLIVYGIGAPLSRAVGLALVAGLAVFVLLRSMDTPPVEWPDPPPGRSDRVAGIQRWRLNGFDALGDRHPAFSPHLRSRLQALSSALLAKRRLEPGSPAAVALLGATTHDLLYPPPREPDQRPPGDPTTGQLTDMVDRLIALSAERVPAAPLIGHPEVSPTKGPS